MQVSTTVSGQPGDFGKDFINTKQENPWTLQVRPFLRKEDSWINGEAQQMLTPEPPARLLKPIGRIVTPASNVRFVAKDTLIGFSGFTRSFRKSFLEGDGKTEEPTGELILSYGELQAMATDTLVIEELGGDTKVESTLFEMFTLLKRQLNGEVSILAVNDWSNMFYIRDCHDKLRLVRQFSNRGRLWVDALQPKSPFKWCRDCRFFSRNPALVP